MKKQLWRRPVSWLVGGIAAALVILALLPQQVQVCETNPQSGQEDCVAHQILAGNLLRLINFVEGHHGFFLVAFTALLFIVTGLLWHATRSLVTGAEDTARRQLRAYVFVVDVAPGSGVQPPLAVSYRLTLKNSGQTPAYDVRIRGRLALVPPGQAPPVPTEPLERTSRVVIAPGAVVYHDTRTPTTGSEEWAVLQAQTHDVYLSGVIWYRDAFGTERHTNLLAKRLPNSHEVVACADGNDAT
jgi:hypothetical protein